jgi:NADH:ubiquinone oxidoreductase subunit 6 (subunit J)
MTPNSVRLAQSASALGAGILGFGIGVIWGASVATYALIIVFVGAVLHVWGMYVMQLKEGTPKADQVAKLLWVSAWICLILLVGLVIYLTLSK